ncbi:hypothetical protein [Streptomyces melanogenes]|uniref:hypothetical protein n=1 Tax=Streptomyces melanogenes TaxID=67326 RepID=UPI00379DE993
MQPWETVTEPGTIDDLVCDAHAAGFADVEARLIHSWISKGLLDRPQRRTLHRGSHKAEHGVNQRRLLLLLLDKRRQITRLNSLAQVPLALWLWWGDAYVPTRQAQRAWVTWVGRGQRSKDVARQGALGLLEQIGHRLATPTARTRLERLVTELGSGTPLTPRGRAELFDAVRAVMEPDSVFAASGLIRALGPVQAPMTVDVAVGRAEALHIALQHTQDGHIDASVLERARGGYRASMADYLAQRPQLAATAGPLAGIFHEPNLEEQINSTGNDLLFAIGLELLRHRARLRG